VLVGESNVLESEHRSTSGVSAPGGPEDGPGAGLRSAVEWLRRELTAHRPLVPDQSVAEDEMDALDHQADIADRTRGPLDSERMRHSLLLVAAVLGSVSALAAPLEALREAVEVLAPPRI